MNARKPPSSVAPNVVVIGAGPAGVTAAAAAADRGAGVVLIEATGRLGGSVTAAMHRSLCGLYADDPGEPSHTLNGAFQRTLVQRLVELAPADVRPKPVGKVWVLEFPTAAYEAALASMIEQPKIERRMNTRVRAVRRAGRCILAIELEGDHAGWIDSPALIDCTGGGAVLSLIGDDVLQPADDGRMLGGFGVRLRGISDNPELLRLQIPYTLAKAVAAGELPALARFTVFHPGPEAGCGVLKMAVDVARATSPCSNDAAEHGLVAHATKDALAILDILKSGVAGLKDASIVECSPRVLPRDGRRMLGRYTLTEEDVLTARSFGGDSVKAWWPAERWDAAVGPTYDYPPIGQPYEIPADSLRCAAIDNLFAGGNTISATAGAAASSRVSGICLATGSAAGVLAADWVRSA